jgi:hypothetical protein
MHIEIQVALNFVISYLYNKLPRRRVNIFGEELEKALKQKFQGHWYPDKPFKVSIDFPSSSRTHLASFSATHTLHNEHKKQHLFYLFCLFFFAFFPPGFSGMIQLLLFFAEWFGKYTEKVSGD